MVLLFLNYFKNKQNPITEKKIATKLLLHSNKPIGEVGLHYVLGIIIKNIKNILL